MAYISVMSNWERLQLFNKGKICEKQCICTSCRDALGLKPYFPNACLSIECLCTPVNLQFISTVCLSILITYVMNFVTQCNDNRVKLITSKSKDINAPNMGVAAKKHLNVDKRPHLLNPATEDLYNQQFHTYHPTLELPSQNLIKHEMLLSYFLLPSYSNEKWLENCCSQKLHHCGLSL